jgi:hypothetical protein
MIRSTVPLFFFRADGQKDGQTGIMNLVRVYFHVLIQTLHLLEFIFILKIESWECLFYTQFFKI